MSDALLIVGLLLLLAAAGLSIVIVGLVGVIFVLVVLGIAALVGAFAVLDGKGLSWRS